MNVFEHEIDKYTRRIKAIEENPDPKQLKANKLLYECERDLRVEQLEALKAGEPLAEASVLDIVARAMGFKTISLILSADKLTGEADYVDDVRKCGLPEWVCDRTIVPVAEVMKGYFPAPAIMVVSNAACDPEMAGMRGAARLCGDIPCFTIDYPIRPSLRNLEYIAHQLYEFVEFAERRFPSKRLSHDRLKQLMELDGIAKGYMKRIWNLKATVPCPMSGRDAFRIGMGQVSQYPNPMKGLEYLKAFVEEGEEKAARGFTACTGGERLRWVWAITGPFLISRPLTWVAVRASISSGASSGTGI